MRLLLCSFYNKTFCSPKFRFSLAHLKLLFSVTASIMFLVNFYDKVSGLELKCTVHSLKNIFGQLIVSKPIYFWSPLTKQLDLKTTSHRSHIEAVPFTSQKYFPLKTLSQNTYSQFTLSARTLFVCPQILIQPQKSNFVQVYNKYSYFLEECLNIRCKWYVEVRW